jgi:hypothetical protein
VFLAYLSKIKDPNPIGQIVGDAHDLNLSNITYNLKRREYYQTMVANQDTVKFAPIILYLN